MSLLPCPECGHEISENAVACANCGHPMSAAPQPVVERKVVVMDNTPKNEGFPPWALIPIGLLAVILIFVMYLVWGNGGEDTANIRVNANTTRQPVVTQKNEPSGSTSGPSTIAVPDQPPAVPSSQTSVPGSQTSVAESPTTGKVIIQAKVVAKDGSTQAVRNERFYLLDQDVETILGKAGILPIEGQTLTSSLGLSIVFPDRYGDFGRKALNAINKHVKYTGQSNGSGSAELSGVEPTSYYLFALTKVGRGFSVWNSPVTIQIGDNALTLTPQSLTEIQAPAG